MPACCFSTSVAKESTGLPPHAWLRQYRLEQAMNMLRDTDASIVSVAAEFGYAS
jgi:AraC family transcriptional regulator